MSGANWQVKYWHSVWGVYAGRLQGSRCAPCTAKSTSIFLNEVQPEIQFQKNSTVFDNCDANHKKEMNQKSMETVYRTWFLGLIDNIDACTLYFLYIKPLHLGFCPSRCDSKCDQKSLKNVQISTVWAS